MFQPSYKQYRYPLHWAFSSGISFMPTDCVVFDSIRFVGSGGLYSILTVSLSVVFPNPDFEITNMGIAKTIIN